MNVGDIRFLFGYDRWGTRRVLNACADLDVAAWSRPNAIGDRGLGGILVHTLGAHQRWRHAWQASDDKPRPEREPVPSPADLRDRWETEWDALDGFLAGLTDAPSSMCGTGFHSGRRWPTS